MRHDAILDQSRFTTQWCARTAGSDLLPHCLSGRPGEPHTLCGQDADAWQTATRAPIEGDRPCPDCLDTIIDEMGSSALPLAACLLCGTLRAARSDGLVAEHAAPGPDRPDARVAEPCPGGAMPAAEHDGRDRTRRLGAQRYRVLVPRGPGGSPMLPPDAGRAGSESLAWRNELVYAGAQAELWYMLAVNGDYLAVLVRAVQMRLHPPVRPTFPQVDTDWRPMAEGARRWMAATADAIVALLDEAGRGPVHEDLLPHLAALARM